MRLNVHMTEGDRRLIEWSRRPRQDDWSRVVVLAVGIAIGTTINGGE